MKRIVITGPESSGKTDLVKKLARHYKTPFIKEYAREYLDAQNGKYEESDLLEIAKLQVQKEDEISVNFDQDIIFIDTDLITIKIWAIDKFQRCDPWILDQIQKRKYDFYLLCKPDVPWMADPLRENPHDRFRLFKMYESALYQYKKKFGIVEGLGSKRLENAIHLIEKENH